ncbi:MAG: Na+/H+ antiporter subunit E [Pseudomonadota bacterium]
MEITFLVHAANEAVRITEEANTRSLDMLNAVSEPAHPLKGGPAKPEIVLRGEEPANFGVVSLLAVMATFALLLLPFLMPLSGATDILYLAIGLLCCGAVAYMYQDLFFASLRERLSGAKRHLLNCISLLLYQVVFINLGVTKRVLQCRSLINPGSTRLKVEWGCDLSMMTVGDLINLMHTDPAGFDKRFNYAIDEVG